MSVEQPPFDPYAILAALDRQRVTYILIGGFARVIQGAEELTHGLDLTPSLRPENLRRLTLALEDLGAERLDHRKLLLEESTIRQEPILELRSPAGELKIVPEPAGTRGGYDDLRRAANREPIGQGPAPLRRLARRPRPHARRPRPRTRPATAPTTPTTPRARTRPQPRHRTLTPSRRSFGPRVQQLLTAIASETQMHRGANMRQSCCTLSACHAGAAVVKTEKAQRPVAPEVAAFKELEVFREATRVKRLAYTRTQAARALGISTSTFERRILPFIETVQMDWGKRFIPVDELERFLAARRQHSRAEIRRPVPPGRKPGLPPEVVTRIQEERAQGKSLRRIAQDLNKDQVRTSQGGRQWWPSTVRAVLVRPTPPGSARASTDTV